MYKFILKQIENDKRKMAKWYQEKCKTIPLDKDIMIEKNITYLNDDNKYHQLDVYYKKEIVENRPVILNFHGGGLLVCEKEINQWFSIELAKRGFLVFCIDYPHVPEYTIYDILKDSYQGVLKSVSLIEKYKGDKNRIFLCGDSAGGYIATYLTAIQNNQKVADSLNIKRSDFKISGLGLISGMIYTRKYDKQGIFLLKKDYYGSSYRKNEFYKYTNPECKEVLESIPNTILITAKNDYLRNYTIQYSKILSKNHKKIKLLDYQDNPNLLHDFVCLNPEYDESQDAINNICQFFQDKC